MKEPELIIEGLDDVKLEDDGLKADGQVAGEAASESADEPTGIVWEESQPAKGKEDTLRKLKEQVSEDDDIPAGTLTLRQVVGGDYLLALVRHYLGFIALVVLLTCIYVGTRYQCQQDIIQISWLEKELVDAKYRALSSSSNLTELCRQSNVLKVLSENEDNVLTFPEQPPYIIEVKSEK